MILFDILEQFDILHLANQSHCIVRLSELYYALFINILYATYCHVSHWGYTDEELLQLQSKLTFKETIAHYLVAFHSFVSDLVYDLTGASQPFYIYSFTISLFSNIFLNCSGMFPTTLTLTTQLLITFALALANLIEVFICALMQNGVQFLFLFIPSGVPLLLLPLLVFVDTLSILSRVFSLAIRLFANLLAGHLLIKIISFFLITCLGSISGTGFSFLFLVVIILILLLEIAISFLQAYVWLVLSTIYFESMAANLH